MHYLALMFGREDGATPGPDTPEFAAEVERYVEFEARAGRAIAGGHALFPAATAVQVRRPAADTLMSDGPFPENAEVVGGYYVFDCANLDDAIQLARKLPAAEQGTVEVRPMVNWNAPDGLGADGWLALLWERPEEVIVPDTPEWKAALVEHEQFAEKVGAAIRGGGAVHPPSTATTVRVREGELLLSDGPFAESAEIVDGVYVLAAPDVRQATELAAQIPISPTGRTEVRKIVNLD
ncbi:YciI family protein [Nocardia sp. CDC159]|uniref:YciI family protein n=2 Tax=Nocardiaceae TaxID=85025 RepID=A0A9X2EA19_9NOCA|nr:YciI family protein [Nocardia pulmonis]MCM6788890.1 YciI family protein [Nocardia sp. CDC159]